MSSPIIERYGIVGINKKLKWVIFFEFSPLDVSIGEIDEIIVNEKSTNGLFDDNNNIVSKINNDLIKNAIDGARNYIQCGMDFAKINPPDHQYQFNHIL